jgi:hypothetical protein
LEVQGHTVVQVDIMVAVATVVDAVTHSRLGSVDRVVDMVAVVAEVADEAVEVVVVKY